SLLSREALRRFPDEVGVDSGYRPCGYLWLGAHAAQVETLPAARRIQHECGLTDSVAVSPDDIARLNPALRLDGIAGGAWCPTDGFLRAQWILDRHFRGATAQR